MITIFLVLSTILAANSWAISARPSSTMTLISCLILFALFWKILISPNNILRAILRLEIFMLITLILMFITHCSSNSFIFILFFTLAVAEASAGLGVVIKNIRTFETLYHPYRDKLNKLLIFKIKIDQSSIIITLNFQFKDSKQVAEYCIKFRT